MATTRESPFSWHSLCLVHSHESIWAWEAREAVSVIAQRCLSRCHGRLRRDVDLPQGAHEGSRALPRAVR
jgi:hypothetical protein